MILQKIGDFFFSLLRIDLIRLLVGLIRYKYFSFFKNPKNIVTPYMTDVTIAHNKSAFNNIKTDFIMNRIKYLYGPMSAIERINRNSRILLIGSRTENEFLYLRSFNHKNIKAIDLMSYSPLIEIQDMHNLNFKDNTFDAVIMGWVLCYSNHPKKCASEITRVLKNDGIVAIGQEGLSSNLSNKNAVNNLKDIHNLFNPSLNKIYFEYNAENSNLSETEIFKISKFHSSHFITLFSIKK
jgi:SAM-dependent methyltransferase